jgi:hypothetical protein
LRSFAHIAARFGTTQRNCEKKRKEQVAITAEPGNQLPGGLDHLKQAAAAATFKAAAGLDKSIEKMVDLAHISDPHGPKTAFDSTSPPRVLDPAVVPDLETASRSHILPLKRIPETYGPDLETASRSHILPLKRIPETYGRKRMTTLLKSPQASLGSSAVTSFLQIGLATLVVHPR